MQNPCLLSISFFHRCWIDFGSPALPKTMHIAWDVIQKSSKYNVRNHVRRRYRKWSQKRSQNGQTNRQEGNQQTRLKKGSFWDRFGLPKWTTHRSKGRSKIVSKSRASGPHLGPISGPSWTDFGRLRTHMRRILERFGTTFCIQ